jgi:hypothetical protein
MGEDMRYLLIALLIATVAEGSRVGVYRGHESAQLRRATTELWTPADLDGLALWLDASDASTLQLSGSSVTNWLDKSANNNNAVQIGSANNPTVMSNMVYFAADQRLKVVDNASIQFSTGVYSAAAIYRADTIATGGASQQTIFSKVFGVEINAYRASNAMTSFAGGTANACGKLMTDTFPVVGDVYILSTIRGTGSSNFKAAIDGDYGEAVSNTADTSRIGDDLFVGSRNPRTAQRDLRGSIGELVISANGNANDMLKLEGYLAHKWGLTANLPSDHPYKSAPPTK